MIVRKITRRVLDSAKPAGRNPYYIMEGGDFRSLRGFGVRVYWQSLEYGVRYRRNWYPLGRVDLLPLEEAERRARTKLLELIDGRERPELTGQRKTVAEAAALFLSEIEPKLKPKTREEYRRLWDLHLLPRIGSRKLREITPTTVLELKRDIAAAAAARSQGKAGGSFAANRALQQLSACLAFAVRMKWIAENPADERTVLRFDEESDTYALTGADYARLGKALGQAERDRSLPANSLAAIRLILQTGSRPYEILTARLDWCHLDGPAPRIQRPTGKGDRKSGGRAKRRQGRTIWLSPADVEVIRSIERPAGCEWLIPGDVPGQHLTSIDKSWAALRKAAGIDPRATPRSARHGYRTLGPTAGVAKEHMQQLLGHVRGSRMTDEVYLHEEAAVLAQAQVAMSGRIQDLMVSGSPTEEA